MVQTVKKIIVKTGQLLLLFLLLVAVGRSIQVYLESDYRDAMAPYLQMPGAHQMTIRWQTEETTVGKIRYMDDLGNLSEVSEKHATKEHKITLTNLKDDQQYYYQVEGHSQASFHTAPLTGDSRKVRIWVQGDPGYFNKSAKAVKEKAIEWMLENPLTPRHVTDLWITTGDNAYRSGKANEFKSELFDKYPIVLGNIPYIPAYGNHDARRRTFEKLFSFPEKGELGGVPSNTWRYYSMDYGNIHLIMLDSQSSDMKAGSDMIKWLEQDLKQSTLQWKIVVLHHPPYTKGSHDSDKWKDSMGRMVAAREEVVPVLERYGVDLVLSGHSHVYERSHLMGCHYDKSETFKPEYVIDNRLPYRKANDAHSGTVYAVVGASAKLDNGPLNHPAMAVSLKQRGSLVIDIDNNELKAKYISEQATVLDQFVIQKSDKLNLRTVCAE